MLPIRTYTDARDAIAKVLNRFMETKGETDNGTWLSDSSAHVSNVYDIVNPDSGDIGKGLYVFDQSVGRYTMGQGQGGDYEIYSLSRTIIDGGEVTIAVLLDGADKLLDCWANETGDRYLYDVLSVYYRALVNSRAKIDHKASCQAQGVPLA